MPIIGPPRVRDANPAVTVALPIHRAGPHFRAAFESIARQSLADLEILIVLNGADGPTIAAARALAAEDPRARIIELPEANLAGALNVALEAARAPLVARMDGDDLCPPQRLELQRAAMLANPALAALGSAWEVIAPEGRVLATVHPPTDPREARWRLLLGNPFAHGSMMLRRQAVLAAGGYDTACARAQDYELWLRLSLAGGIAAVPQVLYQHRTREPDRHSGSTPEQAAVAAGAMLRAWRALPAAHDPAIETALACALQRGCLRSDVLDAIETVLREAPTQEALLAWLYARCQMPPAPVRAIESCRRSRLREVGAAFRSQGVGELWLWGAGDHTRWLLGCAPDLGIPIAGLVDDSRAGEARFGFMVQPPAALAPGQTALISSDWHEDAIWESSAPHRARGVRVVRLYGP